MISYNRRMLIAVVMVLSGWVFEGPLMAATETKSVVERFIDKAYRDTANTTADWNKDTNTLAAAGLILSKQCNPSVSLDGESYVIVWLDTRNGVRDIYAAKYSSSGSRLWGDTKMNEVAIETPPLNVEVTPKVKCYAGYTYILYAAKQGNVFLQKHDSQGILLWRRQVDAGIPGNWNEYDLAVTNSYGNIYAAYSGSISPYTAYITKFDSAGTKLWGPLPANNANSGSMSARDVSVAVYGDYVYVSHRDTPYGVNGSLNICKINPGSGAKYWASDVIVSAGSKIRIGADSYGNVCVVFCSDNSIYYTKYNPNAYKMLTNISIEYGQAVTNKSEPNICVGAGNYKYLVWLDKYDSYYGPDTRVKGQKIDGSDYLKLAGGGVELSHTDMSAQGVPAVCPVFTNSPAAYSGLWAVWSDDTSGFSNVMANSTRDGTRVFSNDICVNKAAEYKSSTRGQSLAIDTVSEKVIAATLTYNELTSDGTTSTLNVFGKDYSLFGQGVAFYLTNNGGINWYKVTPGVKFTFPVYSSDLRFRTILATTNQSVRPQIEDITVVYDYNGDVTPPAGNPSIPADQGKYRGSTSLTFNWTQGTASDLESGIAGYYLQVARDTGFTDLICNKNVGNVLSYTAAGCLQGSTYYARVRAKNAVGLYGSYSGISDGITVDTTIPEGTPSIPADEGPVANSYTLTFNWTQGTALDSESEIAGYWLQVSTDPDFTALFYNGYVGNVFSKPVSGTTKGVTYYARVRARNGAGLYGSYSGASDGIIVQAQDTTPPKGSPSVPLDAGTYTNSTSLTFNWTKGTAADVETGIAGYYLQVSTIPTFATLVFNGDVGNVLTKTIVNALKGNTYYARVRAKNGEGLYGVYSGVSDGIKVDTTAPVGVASTPLDSGVISVSTTIAFNWTQGTASDPESGISGYWLQVATDTSFANLVFNQLAGNVLTQSIAGCTDGLTYYARVRAVNGAGSYGSYSARSDGIKIQIAGPGNVPYIVYSDSAWSHGFAFDGPNGQTTTSISIDAANATSPAQGTTCTKFTYDKTKEGYIWVFNVYNGLWGPGISLTGNTKLTFKVRSAVAGVKIYFRMGLDYSADTTVKDLPGIPVTLSTAWTTYTIDLTGNNLSSINCFWNFTIGGLDNPSIPNPVIFYIDDVKYTN